MREAQERVSVMHQWEIKIHEEKAVRKDAARRKKEGVSALGERAEEWQARVKSDEAKKEAKIKIPDAGGDEEKTKVSRLNDTPKAKRGATEVSPSGTGHSPVTAKVKMMPGMPVLETGEPAMELETVTMEGDENEKKKGELEKGEMRSKSEAATAMMEMAKEIQSKMGWTDEVFEELMKDPEKAKMVCKQAAILA